MWVFAWFLQAHNQPLGIMEEYCPSTSQSERVLYQLQTQVM